MTGQLLKKGIFLFNGEGLDELFTAKFLKPEYSVQE